MLRVVISDESKLAAEDNIGVVSDGSGYIEIALGERIERLDVCYFHKRWQ